MNKEYDIIIIGAGPAGLFAAANIKSHKKILIIEKNKSSGKKLLMSGTGKCNITQDGIITDFFKHYGGADKFIAPALREFTNNDLIEYFNNRGLKTIEKKGKIFPASENARDVLDLLLNECYLNSVQINFNEPVIKIEKSIDSFIVTTSMDIYHCTKVLVSTGGKSYPTTGSTGDGYYLAKSLGHTIEKPKPALAPVYIENYRFSQISGVSIEKRKISLYRIGKHIHTHSGDIGFTHWGLSGPGILDMSRYIEAGDTLRINLIDRNPETFRNDLNATASTDGKTTIKRFMKSFAIPENLIKIILSELKLDTATHLADINKSLRKQLIESLCGFSFIVHRTGDFNIAMATKGGISLKEVSPKTMESRLVPNLFFAGEVLDIDGDTGGYNIQAAFSTGRLASRWL